MLKILKVNAPVVLAMTAVLLSACENRWSKIPDDELRDKHADCLNISNPAPAMIQVCKNYKRECERRRKNGVYVC